LFVFVINCTQVQYPGFTIGKAVNKQFLKNFLQSKTQTRKYPISRVKLYPGISQSACLLLYILLINVLKSLTVIILSLLISIPLFCLKSIELYLPITKSSCLDNARG